MKVIKISPFGFGCNQYLVTADGKNAVLFDAGEKDLYRQAEKHGLSVCAVFLTHCHFDHANGVSALQRQGVKVYLSKKECALLGPHAELFELAGVWKEEYTVDEGFENGAEYSLVGLKISCIVTPGHTAGSTTYLVEDEKTGEKVLFTGDTLFLDSVGRTDFPTGDTSVLQNSLQELSHLDGDYPVYAGHGEDTTLERERKYNPFLNG